MDRKLEFISTVSFILLIVSMLIALSVDSPIEFDWKGKTLLVVLVGSMLGTIIPLIISKSK
jgi:hypothetical protein